MPGFDNLAREYEARRFPLTHRLDLHGEGPAVARTRALQWVQSFAHEEPGTELLLVVDRAARPGRPAGPVRMAVEKLLDELVGGLIEWWQPFGTGSLALRIAREPRMSVPQRSPSRESAGEGRTRETAGAAAAIRPDHDIPEELLPLARRAVEVRRACEGLSLGLTEVVLRRIWIEAQAMAMAERMSFAAALERLLAQEEAIALDE